MRIDPRQVDLDRILGALKRRLLDVPERLSWYGRVGREARAAVSAYREINAGKRCVVIANGPSLNKTDMSLLRGEVCFCMNRAYLMFDRWGFTPSYFVCSNELVLEQFKEDIGALPMPRFLNFNRRHLFAGMRGIHFLRMPPRLAESFQPDATRPLTTGGTVTYVTLQLAFFMGFKSVVIVGMDHSFVEKGTPGRTEVRSSVADASHAHPQYFPQGVKWQLPDLVRSEHAYNIARLAYERAGRRIIDATVGGHCTVFPKQSLAEALAATVAT